MAIHHTDLRSIALDSQSLERAIEVLSEAVTEFRPTRREMLRYRSLMFSLDMVVISYLLMWVRGLFFAALIPRSLFIIVFVSSMIAVFICLLLNVPLMSRTLKDHKKLQSLGVTDVSRSLWKASRRHRWIDRARSGLLFVVSLTFLMVGVVDMVRPVSWFNYVRRHVEYMPDPMLSFLVLLVPAGLLFAAWQLRNQREEMDLATNAQELAAAFQSLRRHPGAVETVAVPARLLEQATRIESVRIATDRTEAILQSADANARGYAIVIDEKAAQQRTALNTRERLVLEDLLVQLSASGPPASSRGASQASPAGRESQHAEFAAGAKVEYLVDPATRVIRIMAVNSSEESVVPGPTGASDA